MFAQRLITRLIYTPWAAVAGAGSAQADATELSGNSYVSGANGTVGVRLPVPTAGLSIRVYNLHATNGLKIYPHSGGDINDGTQDAAITIEGKTMAELHSIDGVTWASQYTANT